MSRDIIILAPNGRRTKVHCDPDTSCLQVLEDVCTKQGFEPTNYDLKHHNRILDLTTTVRFSNIPNKAILEMVEAEKKRTETIVTIGLTLEDGDRRTADFYPSTSLYDIVISLAPNELKTFQNPVVTYMRQEVVGIPAIKEKTLRQLGLFTGRAVLRLLDRIHRKQANVSAVYRKAQEDIPSETECKVQKISKEDKPGPSGLKDSIKKIKHEVIDNQDDVTSNSKNDPSNNSSKFENATNSVEKKEEKKFEKPSQDLALDLDQENLERRLRIEEEVSFVGSHKAIAFMQPDHNEDSLSDLPDDFYDLTIEEVRKMYQDLQQNRIDLENTPLITSSKRNEIRTKMSQQILNTYKHTVVRIQFPDRIILQGVFSPDNTIEDVQNFVKEHLQNPKQPFHIFSTPLKEPVNPKMTLLESKFVPCVHMHFKWANDNCGAPYLREDIYSQQTSSDAASILASKYRAPSRRKLEYVNDNNSSAATSSNSKQSKMPKWFKK